MLLHGVTPFKIAVASFLDRHIRIISSIGNGEAKRCTATDLVVLALSGLGISSQ